MKRIALAVLFVVFLLPSQAGRSSASFEISRAEYARVLTPLRAMELFKSTVQARGENLDHQGVLIETLDGQQVFASENSDSLFNPASVMKLATSLAALKTLGPDYRYRTDVRADGRVDPATHRLDGDLVIKGSADPMFSRIDAQELGTQIVRCGVSRVTGSLRIAGPFYYFATGYRCNLSRETSASKLRDALRRAGVIIEGPTVFGAASGEALVSHYSDRLIRILLYQNAVSSNAIAEVVGESIGGPQAIQDFLIRNAGVAEKDIFVGRPSGLDVNRITPRAALQVVRALITVLADHSLEPEDAMPVAGVDSGTLRTRFAEDGIRGSVIAKTGTLVTIDNGVSTLVGLARTRSRGTLLFAIFDSDGGVKGYRKVQDQFLSEVIKENGGGLQSPRVEDALANNPREAFSQIIPRPPTDPSKTATAD